MAEENLRGRVAGSAPFLELLQRQNKRWCKSLLMLCRGFVLRGVTCSPLDQWWLKTTAPTLNYYEHWLSSEHFGLKRKRLESA